LLIGIIAAPPFAIALTADYVPRLQPLWISQHLARIVRRIDPQRQAVISISGYHEPSVVFALGTASRLTDRAGVERGLHGPGPAIGIIAEQIETLPEQLPRTGPLDEDPSLRLVEVFSGFNYSKGKPLRISVYSHGLDASPEPPPAAARGR
ncbi:MAG: hypothetical protein KDK91_27715, partial [Gammaproteobacteria bacterium]|nr:hypothetical protein [Gammaproteobacteria bacterium]